MSGADVYRFQLAYFEENAQQYLTYVLTLFVSRTGGPTELSIWDVKGHRVFLKKGVYDMDQPIRLPDLFIGGNVCICARKYKIVAYGDGSTKTALGPQSDVVHVTVSDQALAALGVLMSAASEYGFFFKRVKTAFADKHGDPATVHFELLGEEAVQRFAQLLTDCLGTADVPGVSFVQGGSPAAEQIFEGKLSTATHNNCSVCIVRPHAMREGLAGAVVGELLQAGFELSAMQTFSMHRPQVENFYEVYKTVIPSAQYSGAVSELSSGLCLVIEVRSKDGSAVPVLRELCGPYDVEIAKHLRPHCLRARLGRDNVHNVVHCTDLPEDGPLESQYFFSILPGVGV